MKRTLFISIILIIILYFQYPYIDLENNSYVILQHNNPDKGIFENMLSEKKICIFTNIPNDLTFNKIQPLFFTKEYVKYITETKNKEFKNIVFSNFDYYQIPMSVSKRFNLNYLEKNTSLIYQSNYRFLLINLKDTIKISLFYPNQKKNLYFNKNNKSNIDFFNSDYDKYPNLNKVKYIDILLHKDQMFSIPYKWIYLLTKYEEKDSLILSYSNESIFSKILKR